MTTETETERICREALNLLVEAQERHDPETALSEIISEFLDAVP